MKGRSRTGRDSVKAQRRKATALKRGSAPKTLRGRTSSPTGQETKVARLARELNEAVEQQAATAEVLRVISNSPADLQPVFETMLDNAVRICDAIGGGICRWDGHALHHVVLRQTRPAFAE
jgi:hypothetical protein